MVYRIYVEKKKDLAKEAADLLHEARELLQIRSLTGVRIRCGSNQECHFICAWI